MTVKFIIKMEDIKHDHITRITPIYIWRCMKLGDKINCNNVEVDKMISTLTDNYNRRLNDTMEVKHMLENITNNKILKQLNKSKISKIVRRRHLSDEDFLDLSIRNSIWNDIRPKGNTLRGFNIK